MDVPPGSAAMRLWLWRIEWRGPYVAIPGRRAALLCGRRGEPVFDRAGDELWACLRAAASTTVVRTDAGPAGDCLGRGLCTPALRDRSASAQPTRCAQRFPRSSVVDPWCE